MALAPPHRQFSSSHFDPSFPAFQTVEFLNWHRSSGLRVLYLKGSNDREVAKAAEQTLFHWALDREAKGLDERKLPFTFAFSSRDPLRCSMKGMLTALWLSHFTGQKGSRNWKDYELMIDQNILHHAWTEMDLFKLFTARYIRLMGRNTLLVLQDLRECDTKSRKAFWALLNAFAAKSETSIKIVVAGQKSTDLLYELRQCKDISVDICKVAARNETIREDLDSLIASVSQCKQHSRWIRAILEELKEMGAEKLHGILRLIMDLTGWPRDSSEESFHRFFSRLESITFLSTRDDILRRHLRSIPDQQGLRWIWSWISQTQRPLSYEELAMALCYRNYQESGTFHPPCQVELREASRQIGSCFRGLIESCSGQVHIRKSVRHCLERNSICIFGETAPPHSILKFLLNYLAASETQKRLDLICDEYESRLEPSGRITPPLIADGHDVLFYAVQALPFHLSENASILNEIRDELKATGLGLASWSRAYWAMSNPFSRPEFGTLKSPYETLLKLGNMGIKSIVNLGGSEDSKNSVKVSIDMLTESMDLDCFITVIREGKEDVALSLAKNLISLSKQHGNYDDFSGYSRIAWPPWFLWRATWLNMDRLVSLLLDDAMYLSRSNGDFTAFFSPLHMANRLCHASIMGIFFRHEARCGYERSYGSKAKMLSVAAACGNIRAAKSLAGKDKSLLKREFQRQRHSLSHLAIVIMSWLKRGTTPLFYAVERMNVDLICLLLGHGANQSSNTRIGDCSRRF